MKFLLTSVGISNQTALKIVGGTVEVISEGHWKLFNPTVKNTVG